MLHATFLSVRRADVPRLRDWLESLSTRRRELEESYREEGTRHELFYLMEGPDGPVLVLLSELRDRERGGAAFLRSTLPIDLEFKELIQEIASGEPEVWLLYDSADYVEVS